MSSLVTLIKEEKKNLFLSSFFFFFFIFFFFFFLSLMKKSSWWRHFVLKHWTVLCPHPVIFLSSSFLVLLLFLPSAILLFLPSISVVLWLHCLMHWVHMCVQVELPKDEFVVPTGWRWDGDWYISPELRLVSYLPASVRVVIVGVLQVRTACWEMLEDGNTPCIFSRCHCFDTAPMLQQPCWINFSLGMECLLF